SRIAVLQHRRKQRASHGVLSGISERLAETPHSPIESDASLRMQTGLYTRLRTMRECGELLKNDFEDVGIALRTLSEHAKHLGSDVAFEVYLGAQGGGFFGGLPSEAFLCECLRVGCDGV